MLRPCRVLVLGLALVLGSDPAAAQPDRGKGPTVGVGVTLSPVPVGPFSADDRDLPVAFTVPITFSIVRLEPQIGYVQIERSSGEGSRSTAALTFGIGSFYLVHFERTLLLAGARIGFTRTLEKIEPLDKTQPSTQNDGQRPRKTIDFFLGPAFGGEYYASDHFSVGAEVRLFYLNVDTNRPSGPSATSLQTSGAAFLRFHF